MGFLGAAAPEIKRWYDLRTAVVGKIPKHYYLAVLLFLLMGGVVAVIMEAPTLHAAFYNGLAAPIIITKLAGTRLPAHSSPISRKITFREYLGA